MLSSGLVKKKPTAQGDGLSRNTANLQPLPWFDFNAQDPTGRTQKVRPSIIDFYYLDLLNHYL